MLEVWLLQATGWNLLFLIIVSGVMVGTLYKRRHRAIKTTLLFVLFTLIAILLKTILILYPCWSNAVRTSMSLGLIAGLSFLDISAFCIGIVDILHMRGKPSNWLKFIGYFCLIIIFIAFVILIRKCP